MVRPQVVARPQVVVRPQVVARLQVVAKLQVVVRLRVISSTFFKFLSEYFGSSECTHLVLKEASHLCLQNSHEDEFGLKNDEFSISNSKQTTLLLESQEENEDLVPTGL